MSTEKRRVEVLTSDYSDMKTLINGTQTFTINLKTIGTCVITAKDIDSYLPILYTSSVLVIE